VRRSSDNAELDIGFAAAVQTRTNLAAIPINNDTGQTASGVTMTTVGTGTEFDQSYIDVRWQGTAGGTTFLTLGHGPRGAFNPALQAQVTPGLNYTASVGYRLLAGTLPPNTAQVDALFFSASGAFIETASSTVPAATAALQRGAASGLAPTGAAYCQPIWRVLASGGTVVDFTMRFYAANVELGTGNARPLVQRNTLETIADIGDIDAAALLSFVGSGTGFVTTWYDQSGNARNATQTTAGQQPRIVVNGVFQTEGGRPAVLFDGADDGLASAPWGVVDQPFSRHYVGVRKSYAEISHWINSSDGIPNAAQYDYDPTFHAMYAGSAIPVPLTNNERAVLSAMYNGAASVFAKNGSLTTGNPGADGFNGVRIGGWYNTNQFCANVAMQELIVVASGSIISTADRQTLERNQGDYYGISLLALDQLSAPSAAAYSLRKLRDAYGGSAIRVRRSSDNAELDIGFATATQTRTNLAAIPINNNGGSTAPGVTMTTVGTGTEFGQSYIDVRWQGTASASGALQFNHSAISVPFDPAIHAPVTPGLTYTTSVGFRLLSETGTAPGGPGGICTIRPMMINSGGSFIGGSLLQISNPNATLKRNAIVASAVANTAYIAPNIYWQVGTGAVIDFTVRFYAANVEQGTGNARPLLQRNVPEVVADIGDLDTAALLAFVGAGNGFVTTWYDQSGNGRNATQTTAGQQPQIVSNGVIETQNGRPMPRFDGSNDILTFQGVHDAQWSLAVVGLMGSSSQAFLQFGGINQFGSMFNEAGTYRARPAGAANASAPFTPGEMAVLTATYGVAQTNLWKNGSIGTPSDAAGVASNATSYIGALQSIYYLNGNIGEIIALNGVLSTTDRQTLERNQGQYYTISIS
jgi:hypothetical protein